MGSVLSNCARDEQASACSPVRNRAQGKLSVQPFDVEVATAATVTTLLSPVRSSLEQALEQIFLLCESGISTTIQFLFENYPEVLKVINERRTILVGDTRLELTPLQVAATCGHAEVLRLLLEQPGVEVNKADPSFGMTALHLAVNMGQLYAVEELCRDPRIDIHAQTSEGKAALHLAVGLCFPSIVETILRLHPTTDLRIRDHEGNTALHLAALQPNLRIIALLVNHAALVNLYADSFEPVPREGRAPARSKSHRQLFEALNHNSETMASILAGAIQREQTRRLERSLSLRRSITFQTDTAVERQTPLRDSEEEALNATTVSPSVDSSPTVTYDGDGDGDCDPGHDLEALVRCLEMVTAAMRSAPASSESLSTMSTRYAGTLSGQGGPQQGSGNGFDSDTDSMASEYGAAEGATDPHEGPQLPHPERTAYSWSPTDTSNPMLDPPETYFTPKSTRSSPRLR